MGEVRFSVTEIRGVRAVFACEKYLLIPLPTVCHQNDRSSKITTGHRKCKFTENHKRNQYRMIQVINFMIFCNLWRWILQSSAKLISELHWLVIIAEEEGIVLLDVSDARPSISGARPSISGARLLVSGEAVKTLKKTSKSHKKKPRVDLIVDSLKRNTEHSQVYIIQNESFLLHVVCV